jgi:hypothetical protein
MEFRIENIAKRGGNEYYSGRRTAFARGVCPGTTGLPVEGAERSAGKGNGFVILARASK